GLDGGNVQVGAAGASTDMIDPSDVERIEGGNMAVMAEASPNTSSTASRKKARLPYARGENHLAVFGTECGSIDLRTLTSRVCGVSMHDFPETDGDDSSDYRTIYRSGAAGTGIGDSVPEKALATEGSGASRRKVGTI